MLMLMLLSACGAAGQPAGETTPVTPTLSAAAASQATAAPAPSATATDQPTSPPQPSAAAPATPPPPTEFPPVTPHPTESQPAPAAAPTTQPPVPPELLNPTAAVTITAAGGAWNNYRNQQAGYAVDYPAAWNTGEQVNADGWLVTTFAPSEGSTAVSVLVRQGDAAQAPSDLPNTRCQQVTVGGVPGTRCLDTISFGLSTTIVHGGKTYMIASSGKRIDQAIYRRFLDSFTLIS